jgi:hypothetical protein
MNPENKSSPPQVKSIGYVDATSPESALVQFIGPRQTYGCPKSDFRQLNFTLKEVRWQRSLRLCHQLSLSIPGIIFTLVGWRLDLLPEPLTKGEINFIRAVNNTSSELVIGEPVVFYIRIYRPDSDESIVFAAPKVKA